MEPYFWILLLIGALFLIAIIFLLSKCFKNQEKQRKINKDALLGNDKNKKENNYENEKDAQIKIEQDPSQSQYLKKKSQENRFINQQENNNMEINQNQNKLFTLQVSLQNQLLNEENNQYQDQIIDTKSFRITSEPDQIIQHSLQSQLTQDKASHNDVKIQIMTSASAKPLIQVKFNEAIYQLYKISSWDRCVEEKLKPCMRELHNIQQLIQNYSLQQAASVEIYKYCNNCRKVRGDGNCFYTAFGYQFLSILLFNYSREKFNEFIQKILETKLRMKIFGKENKFQIDDEQLEDQLLQELLNRLIRLKSIQDINQRMEQFHDEFTAYEQSSKEVDGFLYGLSTIFFRNYSNYIVEFSEQKHAFLDRENLLIWEQECNSNEVVIAELAKQLNIYIQVIFIEDKTSIKIMQYGNEQNDKIILLLISHDNCNVDYFFIQGYTSHLLYEVQKYYAELDQNQLVIKTYSQIQTQNTMYELYKICTGDRHVEEKFKPYVRELQNKQQLKANYLLQVATSYQLFKYCKEFREVRGDGNCFYTAFGYQFLSILLFNYSKEQFNEFIQKIQETKLRMKIFGKGNKFQIDDEQLEDQLLQELLNRLIRLKSIQDINQRMEQFHDEFAAYEQLSKEVDGCLYGLSTIFFRNYSDYIVEFSEQKHAIFDRENLLIWEQECNSNEVVIAELAKQLNIYIQVIFIEDKTSIKLMQYGNENNDKIILLLKPGHYNIGYLREEVLSDIDSFIRQYKEIQNDPQIVEINPQLKQEIQELDNKLLTQFQKARLPEYELWKLKQELLQK